MIRLSLVLAQGNALMRGLRTSAAAHKEIFLSPQPPPERPRKPFRSRDKGDSNQLDAGVAGESDNTAFGTSFEDVVTTSPGTSGKRTARRMGVKDMQLAAEASRENEKKAFARARKAQAEVLARMTERGATAEEMGRMEKKIEQLTENEIKSRNRSDGGRIPLLGYKPGELLVFHDKSLNALGNGELDSRVVLTKRVVRMTRGGKRPSQSALVIVGDRKGNVGFAVGRSQDASNAVDSAITRAARRLVYIPRYYDHTIHHEVHDRFKRTRVFMLPAQPGKGLKCHHIIAKICDLAGIEDLTANVLGSQNPLNVVRAAFQCLQQQRPASEVAKERGMSLLEYRFPDQIPNIVARNKPIIPLQTPITVIKRATETWFYSFPRTPWPTELETCRNINDRLLRFKANPQDAELRKQVEQDKSKNGDLVSWLEAMPSLADPRGTLLYPKPELLSPAAQAAYEKPLKP